MRTLRFIINGQTIKKDPKCDFSGLVPGTEGHLKAEFLFSSEWAKHTKVVAFYSVLGVEYDPQQLINGKSCEIPAEALKRRKFKLQVLGKNGNTKLITNKLEILQDGR